LYWMGQWKELSHRFATLLKESQERGDLYLATYLRARIAYALRLAGDDPEKAEQEQCSSMEGWSHQAFHVQHYWDWFSRGEIALYASKARTAWDHVRSGWPDVVKARLHYYEAIFIEATYLHARAALALAAQRRDHEARSLVRQAEQDARRIEREKVHWGRPLAWLIQASVAADRGQAEAACTLAASAEQEFERADMALYAAAARRRRGELQGGDDGTALVKQADLWMANQGIKNPARTTAMLAPGQWRAK